MPQDVKRISANNRRVPAPPIPAICHDAPCCSYILCIHDGMQAIRGSQAGEVVARMALLTSSALAYHFYGPTIIQPTGLRQVAN